MAVVGGVVVGSVEAGGVVVGGAVGAAPAPDGAKAPKVAPMLFPFISISYGAPKSDPAAIGQELEAR